MKEARFLEKDIAKALVDRGYTAYNPKTIGTRWRRLKAALQRRQDEMLDADLSDWHDDDVCNQTTPPWIELTLSGRRLGSGDRESQHCYLASPCRA